MILFYLLVGFLPNCESNSCDLCAGVSRVDPMINWDDLTRIGKIGQNFFIEKFASNPALVHECRLGVASVFYTLAIEESNLEKRHNFHQFVMAMVWDVSRNRPHCLVEDSRWGIDWMNVFMPQYLSLASQLSRHEIPMPTNISQTGQKNIAIATVCDYSDPNHSLFEWLETNSKRNRDMYAQRHGYVSVFKSKSAAPIGKSPVWSAIALVLEVLQLDQNEYVMWMDCDAMFIDQTRRIESLIPNPHADLIISEDGRGLSGGNWIVKNSVWSKHFLQEILTNIDIFDLWDLKDQFALLWSLLRPNLFASRMENRGYPPQVALIPQRLLNAYPWALCRPSHHCFEDGEDFIVSFITLGSQTKGFAKALVEGFASRIHYSL